MNKLKSRAGESEIDNFKIKGQVGGSGQDNVVLNG